jgi:hypothetical protein
MRKTHTFLLLGAGLFSSSQLFAQHSLEQAYQSRAMILFNSDKLNAFFELITSEKCQLFLFIILIACLVYCFTTLLFFLLLNKAFFKPRQIFSLPLMDRKLDVNSSKKEKIFSARPNQIKSEKIPKKEAIPVLIQVFEHVDLPNLDVLNLKTDVGR